MNCDLYITLINGHLDGVNTIAEEETLQTHLKTCENCRSLLSVMAQNDALIKESKAVPPIDLTANIMQKVRNNPKRNSRKAFYTTLAATGLAAAAMLGIFLSSNLTPTANEGISVAYGFEQVSYAEASRRSVQTIGVLVLHGSSDGIRFEGEKLDADNLPNTVMRAGYTITGSEKEAYSVSWAELNRIHETYGETLNASLYNPEANTSGILIFVD